MTGNEVGDSVHNFFGQENLSQSIDGNWPGLSNNLWVGGQRQIGGPFISSLKNYNLQQQDAERGHGSQPSHMPHGLNFTQSNLKPEFGRVHTQNQQPALNGYVHGNRVFQARQNETNFLGVDAHNLVARGFSLSQQGIVPEHGKKNTMRLGASESPVSFDFLGDQQQMSGVLQSIPRQQSGNSDMQLRQWQMMLQQLQEYQRQQQLQQMETKQQSFMNQVSSVLKQTAGNHPPSLINSVPINEASDNLWQPELAEGGTNWLRGASPAMHGLSSGQLRLMDMVPQQADQSLYGVPISSTASLQGPYSRVQMDKAGMQQISVNNNALSVNAYASFPGHRNIQEQTTGQGLGSGFNFENLLQTSPPVQEFLGTQEVAESSELSQETSLNQVTSSHNVATLDPTEENILFGSDDNIWEAFGKSTNLGMGGYSMLDGADYSSGCPLQSGSWSALMQSAVAEASSGDTGIQEEWCGPSMQNSEASTGSQQLSGINQGGNPQGVWSDNNFLPSVASSSRLSSVSVDPSSPNPSINSFGLSQFQQSEFRTSQVQGDMLHSDSSQISIPKFSEQGGNWSDRGPLQKQSVEGSYINAYVGNNVSYANIQGTALPSGFPYSRNLENQHMHAASGQIMINQFFHMPSSGSKQLDDSSERGHANQFVQSSMQDLSASAPQDNLASFAETSQLNKTDQMHKQDLAQQIMEPNRTPVTQLSGQQGAFSKMLPNAWTSVPREQSSLGAKPLKAGLFESQLQPNLSVVTTFSGPPKLNEQHIVQGRNELTSTGVIPENSQSLTMKEEPDREISRQQMLADKFEAAQKASSVSEGSESVANDFSEASLASHAATQRDIEAFGRSLRPNNSLQQNYSLLHQVQAMKSTEIDSADWSTKRLKGSDHLLEHHQVGPVAGQQSSFGYNGAVRDLSANQASVPSGQLKMLSFSSKPGDAWDSNASSQDAIAFAHNSSNNITSSSSGNAPSTRIEHPQISPQMAPSWFDQYGTFKNGQMLQVYDMHRTPAMKSMEQPFMVGKVADDQHPRDLLELGNITPADGSQLGIIQQVSAPTSAPNEDLTPQLVTQSSDQSLVGRPKKRKSMTSELVAWNKELTSAIQRLQTVSMAEVEWAKATNRVAEMVEGQPETMKDVLRPRRRLVLTTQLMQQLLRPPPATFLSSDATSQLETAAYFSARLALGDACSATSCSESSAPLPGEEDKSMSPEKLKTPKAIDQHFSEVVENFIGRARRLESELLRLDKKASILDLRVEFQDLEKFSVINRFAKFHGRGQAEGAETSSSSDGTTPNAQKPCPQKYVTALPMPRNPPDTVEWIVDVSLKATEAVKKIYESRPLMVFLKL